MECSVYSILLELMDLLFREGIGINNCLLQVLV